MSTTKREKNPEGNNANPVELTPLPQGSRHFDGGAAAPALGSEPAQPEPSDDPEHHST